MRLKRHWQALVVLLLGVAVTIALTVVAERNYESNQQRLTVLQTKLTASVLQTAQPQLDALLGRVVGLAAEAPNPSASFERSIASQLAPHGRYSTAALVEVQGGVVHVLSHLGARPLRNINSKASTQLYVKAARSSSLITTRVVSAHIQRLAFLLSARSETGVSFVVGLSETLPTGRPVTAPPNSPYANMNFALYFGTRVTPSALVATNVAHLPLSGTVAQSSVPFGNNVLTLVASPRGSLAGSGARVLPWVVLAGGLALAGCAAAFTDYLVRRRRDAESEASVTDRRFREQRGLFESLQRFLLPRVLPEIEGFRFAARYLPATQGTEVGGDWYSVLRVDEHRFAVMIGDVSGHGMSAASIMASARYTIRTLASLGYEPDEMLLRTRSLLDLGEHGRFVTALVGVVDSSTNQLALASAGHLPPVIVHDGRAELVALDPAPPLGVKGAVPPVIRVPFGPGSTLIAFTDGLVERRGSSIDAGLGQLKAAAAESSMDPDELIEALLAALETTDHEDDIAILAVEYLAADVPSGHEVTAPDRGGPTLTGARLPAGGAET